MLAATKKLSYLAAVAILFSAPEAQALRSNSRFKNTCFPEEDIKPPVVFAVKGESNPSGAVFPIVPSAVVSHDATGERVKVRVTNLWDRPAKIGSFHQTDRYQPSCDNRETMKTGDFVEFELYCFQGHTDLSLFVYMDNGEDNSQEEETFSDCRLPAPESKVLMNIQMGIDCRRPCPSEEGSGPNVLVQTSHDFLVKEQHELRAAAPAPIMREVEISPRQGRRL